MLILPNFFLKYEVGLKLTPLPQFREKTILKKPSLIRVNRFCFFQMLIK